MRISDWSSDVCSSDLVPIAVVEIVEGAQTSEQDLKDFVRSQMPAYMVPTSIELVDALPRTLSMKVDRPALRALFQDKYHFCPADSGRLHHRHLAKGHQWKLRRSEERRVGRECVRTSKT